MKLLWSTLEQRISEVLSLLDHCYVRLTLWLPSHMDPELLPYNWEHSKELPENCIQVWDVDTDDTSGDPIIHINNWNVPVTNLVEVNGELHTRPLGPNEKPKTLKKKEGEDPERKEKKLRDDILRSMLG